MQNNAALTNEFPISIFEISGFKINDSRGDIDDIRGTKANEKAPKA